MLQSKNGAARKAAPFCVALAVGCESFKQSLEPVAHTETHIDNEIAVVSRTYFGAGKAKT